MIPRSGRVTRWASIVARGLPAKPQLPSGGVRVAQGGVAGGHHRVGVEDQAGAVDAGEQVLPVEHLTGRRVDQDPPVVLRGAGGQQHDEDPVQPVAGPEPGLGRRRWRVDPQRRLVDRRQGGPQRVGGGDRLVAGASGGGHLQLGLAGEVDLDHPVLVGVRRDQDLGVQHRQPVELLLVAGDPAQRRGRAVHLGQRFGRR